MNKQKVAEKIRTLRKRLNLRQEDLASKSGVSIGVIKDLESAKGNQTIDSISAVLSVLEITWSDLIIETESANSKRDELFRLVALVPDKAIDTLITIIGPLVREAAADKNKLG